MVRIHQDNVSIIPNSAILNVEILETAKLVKLRE
jgi:hypothetical protein